MISYDEFSKIDLRVAEIIKVKEIEGADKLLQLIIDIGEEKQIVAGIKTSYSREELIGKQIIVVNNLESAKIRGIESNGMLLAATENGEPILLTIDKPVKNGSRIK